MSRKPLQALISAFLVVLAVGSAAPAQAGTATTIPDKAMLQPADLGGRQPTPVTDDWWDFLRPPQPCRATPYPSTALVRADRAVSLLIGVGESPTSVMEHVALYRNDGAHRYFGDLRRALRACDRRDPHAERWTILAARVAGNESVLLHRRIWIDYAGSYQNSYMVVARVGRALVVVADLGWETASGHKDLVRDLARKAVRRAAVLNRR